MMLDPHNSIARNYVYLVVGVSIAMTYNVAGLKPFTFGVSKDPGIVLYLALVAFWYLHNFEKKIHFLTCFVNQVVFSIIMKVLCKTFASHSCSSFLRRPCRRDCWQIRYRGNQLQKNTTCKRMSSLKCKIL